MLPLADNTFDGTPPMLPLADHSLNPVNPPVGVQHDPMMPPYALLSAQGHTISVPVPDGVVASVGGKTALYDARTMEYLGEAGTDGGGDGGGGCTSYTSTDGYVTIDPVSCTVSFSGSQCETSYSLDQSMGFSVGGTTLTLAYTPLASDGYGMLCGYGASVNVNLDLSTLGFELSANLCDDVEDCGVEFSADLCDDVGDCGFLPVADLCSALGACFVTNLSDGDDYELKSSLCDDIQSCGPFVTAANLCDNVEDCGVEFSANLCDDVTACGFIKSYQPTCADLLWQLGSCLPYSGLLLWDSGLNSLSVVSSGSSGDYVGGDGDTHDLCTAVNACITANIASIAAAIQAALCGS